MTAHDEFWSALAGWLPFIFIREKKRGLSMNSIPAKCSDCIYCDKFTPRKDEMDRGLVGLGCKCPGWEGYVKEEDAERCRSFMRKE